MKKTQIIKGIAFEINPEKSYMIIFDQDSISQEDIVRLVNKLPFSNSSIAVMIKGDPSTVKVIEQ